MFEVEQGFVDGYKYSMVHSDVAGMRMTKRKDREFTLKDLSHFFSGYFNVNVQVLPALKDQVPPQVARELSKYAYGATISSARVAAKVAGYLKFNNAPIPPKTADFIRDLTNNSEFGGTFRARRNTQYAPHEIKSPTFHPDNMIDAAEDLIYKEKVTISVGHIGSLRELSTDTPNSVMTNGSVFLLDPREDDSFFTALGDLVGLQCSSGEIFSPPQIGMPALCLIAGEWLIERFNEDDAILVINGEVQLRNNSAEKQRIYFRSDTADYCTPAAEDKTEFAVVGTTVVATKKGGGLIIPQSGAVISISDPQLVEATKACMRGAGEIRWEINRKGLEFACQCGPVLIENGVCNDVRREMEMFAPGRRPMYIAPVTFHIHTDLQRNRTAVGIGETGKPVAIAVEKIALGELAKVAKRLGIRSCINLDGGGSSQMFCDGGSLSISEDSRLDRFARWDRMVPVGLHFS